MEEKNNISNNATNFSKTRYLLGKRIKRNGNTNTKFSNECKVRIDSDIYKENIPISSIHREA